MNTPTQNLISVVQNKKCLFLENDNSLHHGLDKIETILKDNNVEYRCLFNINELYKADKSFLKTVEKVIKEYDVIIFQTQWVYEVSKLIEKYILSLSTKKVVIECYIGDATYYYRPDSAHDLYIYKNMDGLNDSFYKLSDKPYWEYQNNFDK